MISSFLVAGLTVGGGVIGAMARRQHLGAKEARAHLLHEACGALEDPKIQLGLDGFPVLCGRHRGAACKVALIPDSMTAGRLPQLWLVVTLEQARKDLSSLGVLVRPNAGDFFSITQSFHYALPPPERFPPHVLVRGRDAKSQATLRAAGKYAGQALLEDPKIKELVLTPNGLRIVWQASQGDRGNHQFLRQMKFLQPALGADVVSRRLAVLDGIGRALDMQMPVAA